MRSDGVLIVEVDLFISEYAITVTAVAGIAGGNEIPVFSSHEK